MILCIDSAASSCASSENDPVQHVRDPRDVTASGGLYRLARSGGAGSRADRIGDREPLPTSVVAAALTLIPDHLVQEGACRSLEIRCISVEP